MNTTLSPDVSIAVMPEMAGERLDRVAASLFHSYSRSRLQTWIREGFLTVDGLPRRNKDRLLGGEILALSLPPDVRDESVADFDGENVSQIVAEPVPVPLVYEDQHVLVVNKPVGLVMHPAPGNWRGTLMNGLLHLDANLARIPRAGIVHRLDKDTSGLCVVARTLTAHTHLVRQLQERSMGRRYLALAQGDVPINGTIDAPIGRHPKDRKRMAVVSHGRRAVTHFECLQRFADAALVSVRLETGRTHQIRVHLAHLGHPLIGDPVYGRRAAVLPKSLSAIAAVSQFKRQALHATELDFRHPADESEMSWQAAVPDDMQTLLDALDRNQS